MSSQRRVQQQPGYILHHRPFRDSSQILTVVTRDHGKVDVVARGSRAARSKLAGVLRPFLPLRVSWVSKSDLGTLTGAEAAGAPAGMTGDALLSGYYVNELLMHFLHRHDPQTEIFTLYERTLHGLVQAKSIAANLRSFEMELLGLLGYGVNLAEDADSLQALEADKCYEFRADRGVLETQRSGGAMIFRGATLTAIAAQQFESADVLRAANRLLREVIAFHLGGKELKSRKVLIELHRGRIAASKKRTTDT